MSLRNEKYWGRTGIGYEETDINKFKMCIRDSLYRVDVTAASPDKYKSESGEEIPATNLILCIDPGHFEGKNAVTSDDLGYAEGDFSLALAIELEKTLKETYGISSKLTRNSGTITIDGYEDRQLDSSHISLRGELAKDCDLFVSLHTNANLENAGGSPTEQQPISINKPIIFVNSVALDNPTALRIANEVGSRLAAASFDQGLSETKAFREAQKQEVLEWTDAYNAVSYTHLSASSRSLCPASFRQQSDHFHLSQAFQVTRIVQPL